MADFSVDFDGLKKELETLAKQFVKDNKDEAAALGDDLVKAILFSAVSKKIPVPVCPPDATPEQAAEIADLLMANTTRFQLIADAQRQYSEHVDKLEKNAANVASKVVPIILTALLKPLAGL